MRKFIIAATVALAASLTAGASAQASGLKIIIGDQQGHSVRHAEKDRPVHVISDTRHKPVPYKVIKKVVTKWDRKHLSRKRDCYDKKVVTFHRGRKVVKMKTVCR